MYEVKYRYLKLNFLINLLRYWEVLYWLVIRTLDVQEVLALVRTSCTVNGFEH